MTTPAASAARLRLEALLSSPEPFRAWLAESRAWRIGRRAKCRECPIAEFLIAHGFVVQEVAQCAVWIEEDGEREGHWMPSWVTEFINAVDDSGPEGSGILRVTALRLLDQSLSQSTADATSVP